MRRRLVTRACLRLPAQLAPPPRPTCSQVYERALDHRSAVAAGHGNPAGNSRDQDAGSARPAAAANLAPTRTSSASAACRSRRRRTLPLSLAVNLFSWDSWVALKAADATVAQAEANYQAAAQSLIQRVSQQYFAVLAAQDTLTAAAECAAVGADPARSGRAALQSRPDRDHRCGDRARLARQHRGGRDRSQARAGDAAGPAARDHQ